MSEFTKTFQKELANEAETLQIAAKLAESIEGGAIIFLYGQLGAGKTTFTRGFLQALGYSDKVKSPTYTLVEPYYIHNKTIFHFDLYRVNNPEELNNIGIQEYFFDEAICLVEWPEKGEGLLPQPDIKCQLDFLEARRLIKFEAVTKRGENILKDLCLTPNPLN